MKWQQEENDNSDYGYFFCCPANADDMVATIKKSNEFWTER